jgi:UDP-N-acetylmuramoyl-L-alanyl-D-glutamate--2,6-diaminopimelate ligase
MNNYQEILKKYQIKNISLDSRNIQKDSAFVALKGDVYDGNDFIAAVKEKNIKLIFTDNKEKIDTDIYYIEELKTKLTEIAKFIYNNYPENIIAVTGTNGKTSITDIISQIYCHLHEEICAVGTLGVYKNHQLVAESNLTTPDIFKFYEILNKYSNSKNFIFEASSHGLMQQRFGDLQVKYAIFTNLTEDHLDYHKNMENYYAAKLLLFTKHLTRDGIAIINSDDKYGKKLSENLQKINKHYIIEYGYKAKDLQIVEFTNNNFIFQYKNKTYKTKFPFTGEFQLYNLMAAISYFVTAGYDINKILEITSKLEIVKGRLEKIISSPYEVFIDFAHTPDALENILKTLQNYTDKEIILVFGCGGNRDKGKRAKMAKIAAEYASHIIVTDDNPRFEDPAEIRKEICQNLKKFLSIGDRSLAIKTALKMASDKHIVLIAGKGHEEYQIIGDNKIAYSDKKEILKYYKNVE